MVNMGAVTNEPTLANKTGTWRTFKPVIIDDCRACGICVMFCPEGCINLKERKNKSRFQKIAEIDYDYCKGCMLCLAECPFKAILEEKETK